MKKLNTSMKVGLAIVIFFSVIAIFADVIAPHDPTIMNKPYEVPSREHFLGTNDVGQDIFSEIVYGTRVSLIVGFFAAFVTTGVASVFGISAGYFGGKTDNFITALTNIAMSIPSLPLTVLLVAFMKPGKLNLIVAISITAWTGTARVLRAKTKELVTLPFIKIEKTLGIPNFKIMYKHILPNLSDIIMLRGALSVSSAMVTEAGLSFLGLGSYGEKSWGSILKYAFFRNSILRGQVWWYLPPIICISVTVLGFMLIGYYGVNDEK